MLKIRRPDLKLDKQWTNKFGEHICEEIYSLLGKVVSKPVKKEHYQPDSEVDDAIVEAKAGTFHTGGTAGEKILGCPFKYAEIPDLYGKSLKILCMGGAEKICRESYGNLPGVKCSPQKKKFLDFFRENRIEYIFDLIQGKKKDDEDFFTFNEFYNEFEKNREDNGILKIDPLWLKIKKYFLILEEWYNDKDLYHLIGFLIEYNHDINKLKSDSNGLNKSNQKVFLKQEIREMFKNIDIDDLEYGATHNKLIKMNFLLFNIQTILATQKAEMRFPFDKYKEENWDIEHVKSQTEKSINKSNAKDWALDILEYLTGQKGYSNNLLQESNKTTKEIQLEHIENLDEKDKDFASRLIHLLEQEKIDDEYFKNLYDDLTIEFKESDFEQDDNISNLALLDENTNRSYGNAMFPIKRKRIIENDMNGIFVPICTKNLFLKYYSKKMGNVMYWRESDAKDYLESIKKLLKEYLPTS